MLKYIRKTILISLVALATSLNMAYAEDFMDEEEYSYSYAEISNKCPVHDPYERLNRKIFRFNMALDKALFTPLARFYGAVTNDYFKARANSFFRNFKEPLSTVNYTIQGKPNGILSSFWRFMINTTVGIGGIFDVASKFGLKAESQTLSQTLAYYGVGPGPYIVLPILGGYGAREAADILAFDFILNPLTYVVDTKFQIIESSGRLIHYRERALPFTDHVNKTSVDPYITIRDAIHSERENRMDYPDDFVCPHGK